jgi:hypothetical protein
MSMLEMSRLQRGGARIQVAAISSRSDQIVLRLSFDALLRFESARRVSGGLTGQSLRAGSILAVHSVAFWGWRC